MAFLWVGVGGFLGAVARFQVGRWLAATDPENATTIAGLSFAGFPLATLTVNVAGSFFIGLLGFLNIDGAPLHENLRLLLITGVLGGFTTFSAFSLETLQLMLEGGLVKAIANIVANLVLCLLFVALGASLARAI